MLNTKTPENLLGVVREDEIILEHMGHGLQAAFGNRAAA